MNTTTRPLPPNKRRRIPKVSLDSTTNTNVKPQPSNTLKLDALDIVQSQHLLDIKTKNTNLQALIDELAILSANYNNNATQDKAKDKQLNHKLSTYYKQQYKANSILELGPYVERKSWSEERGELVYDLHVKDQARRYSVHDEPNYPAMQDKEKHSSGHEALLLALGKDELVNDLKLLQIKNYYLGTKLRSAMVRLELNIDKYNYVGHGNDYFMMARRDSTNRLTRFKQPLSAAEEADMFSRLDGNLSELSNTDLIDYVKDCNMDLREGIAKLSTHASIDCEICSVDVSHFEYEFGLILIEEAEDTIRDSSLKFLPGTRGVLHDPLLEMENYWLSEKLEHSLLVLKLAVLEDEIYNPWGQPNDDEEDEEEEEPPVDDGDLFPLIV